MLEMLLNIDMSCGFCRKLNVENGAKIPKCCKCCRILTCFVDSAKHQILQMEQGFPNIANGTEY